MIYFSIFNVLAVTVASAWYLSTRCKNKDTFTAVLLFGWMFSACAFSLALERYIPLN